MAAPTFFGVATNPADGGSLTEPQTALALTPPASMLAGDLVVVRLYNENGSAGDGLQINGTGGQTWTSDTTNGSYSFSGTAAGHRIYWCTFNGTWSADPTFDFPAKSGTRGCGMQMLVFRPDSTTKIWRIDTAPSWSSYTAPSTPFTVTVTAGYTPTNPDNVTIAGWASDDDNTWGTLTGTGWSKTGLGAQYANTGGSDLSTTFAYLLQGTAASVPDVSQNQATLGGDAGATFIVTFYADVEFPPLKPNKFESVTVSEGGGNGLLMNMKLLPSVAEANITVTESVVPQIWLLPRPFDTVVVTESSTAANRLLPASVFDSATVTEGVTQHLLVMPQVFDATTVTEYSADTRIPLSFMNVSDTVTVTEGLSVSAGFTIPAGNYIRVTEEGDRRILESAVDQRITEEDYIWPVVSDDVTLTEVAALNVKVMPLVFDASTVTEYAFPSIFLMPSRFDSTTVTDVPAFNMKVPPSVFDTATLTEAVVMNVLIHPSAFDSVTVTEDTPVLVRDGTMQLSVFDNVATTEQATVHLYVMPFVADNATVTEQVVMNVKLMPQPFDTATVTEQVSTNMLVFPRPFDAVTVTEQNTEYMGIGAFAFDGTTVTESVRAHVLLFPTVSDTTTVTELVNPNVLLNPQLFDAVTLTESVQGYMLLPASVSDSVTVTEQVDSNMLLFPQPFDAVTVTEFSNPNVIINPFVFDATVVTEFVAEMINLAPFVSDQSTVTDVPVLNMILMPDVSDQATVTEQVTLNMLLMPFVLETVTVSESITVAPVVMNLVSFRWRNDDGNEVAATWLASQDSNAAASIGQNVRLRVQLDTVGDVPARNLQLEFRKVGDSVWKKVI